MKTDLIQLLNSKNTKKSTVDIKVGDTVRVHTKIKEGNKERVQVYEGVVIGLRHGKGVNGTFTVRKISYGIGVERVFPLHSPNVVKIEVKKRAKVRRAKLTYLRALTGKKARLRETKFDSLVVNTIEEEPEVVESDSPVVATEKEAPEVKVEADEKEIQEDTEVNPETQEDEAAIAEESTEDLAKEETKKSEKAHREEEEAGREDDESNLPEEEVEEGIEKAEDQDTKGQEDKG